jgi:hypothetical protein
MKKMVGWWPWVVLALAIVALVAWVQFQGSGLDVRVTELGSEIPPRFDENLPVEDEGSRVFENYIANAPGNREQSTRTFETSLSFEESRARYVGYLVEAGWQVLASSYDEQSGWVASAVRKGEGMQISAQDQPSGGRIISVSIANL